jgi:hypothetical protein
MQQLNASSSASMLAESGFRAGSGQATFKWLLLHRMMRLIAAPRDARSARHARATGKKNPRGKPSEGGNGVTIT